MNAKERNKLQQYIGHCSNLDEQIRYIETVNSVSPLTDEDWYKLYFPACGNCDVSLFKWLQKRGAKINYDAASLLKWTVNRQQYGKDAIMRQLEISKLIIDELAENKAQIMGQAQCCPKRFSIKTKKGSKAKVERTTLAKSTTSFTSYGKYNTFRTSNR